MKAWRVCSYGKNVSTSQPRGFALRTVQDSFPSYGSSISKSATFGRTRPQLNWGLHDSDRLSFGLCRRAHHLAKADVICFPFLNDSFYVLVTRHLPDFSLFTESRHISRRDILATTAKHSLHRASHPRPPTACLTVSLPRGRRHWVATFRIIDHH